jgi:hypothetical protein
MDRTDAELHFHIHWSGKTTLDCESFTTWALADERAKELVAPNERYSIEELGKQCPICSTRSKTARGGA